MKNGNSQKVSIGSRNRVLKGKYKVILISFISFALTVVVFNIFHFTIFGWSMLDISYFYLLMALFLPMVFLIYPAYKGARTDKIPWYDLLLAVLCFLTSMYYFSNAWDIVFKAWEINPPALAKYGSLILCLLALEAGRRAAGWPFAIICFIFGAIPLFAGQLPSLLKGSSFPFWMTTSWHAMGRESLLGLPLRIVATILIGFMVFGAALMALGGGTFFLNFANAILGHTRGGPAKVSVVASAFFGSMSGSIISNIVTTGSFTIPAMKRTGYPSHYAGAIETCASSGGVLMPPVMGAVAFIMAQFLAIPYATVAIAAFIPSLLYYIGLLIQADAFAAKQRIKGLPRKEMPSLRQTLKEGWFYLFAIFILLWFIFYERVEAQAPFYATAALFPLAMIRKENRITTKIVIDFLYETGRIMVELTAILVSIGLIIGSLMMTGIAHSFSYEIIKLAGGNLALLLMLGAITSAILGMGVTISACYVILALVLCPALVKAGIYPIAAHLFVLYWGLVSFITPPVAIGAYAAAGLARSDPMRTAVKSMQFGFVKYLIPFFFVLNPALVLHGPPLEIIYCFITAVVGVTIIGGALEGYLLWVGKLSLWVRPLLLIGGVLIGIPEWRTDLLGIILVFVSLIAFPGTNFLEKILAKAGFRFKEKKKGD